MQMRDKITMKKKLTQPKAKQNSGNLHENTNK